MHRTLTLCRSGLAATAAVVLLTACGGSDEDTQAAESTAPSTSTSAPSSSAAETTETAENTAPQADSQFCTEAAGIQERISESLTSADPTNLGQIFQQASEEIGAIEAPPEIADDWASFADGIGEFARISQIDFQDPAAYAQWQADAAAIQTEFAPAFANVQTYLSTQCGLTDDEASESAAPTS